jgi:UDP-2,3-diacylglucosamine hydrolase
MKTYFLSDIHLGNGYSRHGMEAEKRLVRFLDAISADAAAVYFLGDVFDYWYEYRYVAPKGHVRFLGKIAEMADKGIEIHFLIGNHDIWMFDYLPCEVGAEIHRKPFETVISGKKFFLAHGDEVGYRPLTYRILQSIFRNRFCQWLYASVHPRWTFAFARRWSLRSRKNGMQTSRYVEACHRNLTALKAFSLEYLISNPDVSFFIYGHLHSLENEAISPTARMLVIGDWLNHFSYAVWDGENISINTLTL